MRWRWQSNTKKNCGDGSQPARTVGFIHAALKNHRCNHVTTTWINTFFFLFDETSGVETTDNAAINTSCYKLLEFQTTFHFRLNTGRATLLRLLHQATTTK